MSESRALQIKSFCWQEQASEKQAGVGLISVPLLVYSRDKPLSLSGWSFAVTLL